MFQIVVDVLLVGLVLYAFVAAIFWYRRKSAAEASTAGRSGPQSKPE